MPVPPPTSPAPWVDHVAEVAGRRLAWRRSGSGPALLVLHDAGADVLDAPVWAALAADHDVVVLDLPGYGGSAPPTGLDRAAAVADLLAALLDHLGWDRTAVVGTSLGGWFALELAIGHGDRVAALVLCDAAGLHLPPDYLLALFVEGRAAARTEDLIRASLVGRLPEGERALDAMPAALAAATLAPFVQTLAAAAATSWHPATASPELLGRLGRVACPTTIVWGERDALIPLDHGRLLAEAIPRALLVVVGGAGHLPPVERPDVVAAAVRGRTAGR
jgi:pimeloyl-ACP methyl ester carboxylesterase